MEDEDIGSTADIVEQDAAVTEEAPVVEKTMDDTIRETLNAINERGEETPEQTAQRARDEQGRFAKKDAAPEATVPAPEQEDPPASDSPPVAAPVVPPELQKLGLRKEEAEAIAANPVALQAFMRRSEEMHKGLEQYRAKAQFGAAMEQAVAPYMATIQAIGPDVAVRNLLAADHALRHGTAQQKTQMLAQLARDYGVDIGQAQETYASQPQADPQVMQLQQQLHQMQNWIQQQNQAREWSERETLNSEISKFASDPANTHFDAVRETMAGLLQAGLARDLKDAYEQAIWTNPTVRAQVLAQQQAQAEAKRKADAAQRAQEAKKAAAINVARRPAMPAARPIGSMDDTILETGRRLGMF